MEIYGGKGNREWTFWLSKSEFGGPKVIATPNNLSTLFTYSSATFRCAYIILNIYILLNSLERPISI